MNKGSDTVVKMRKRKFKTELLLSVATGMILFDPEDKKLLDEFYGMLSFILGEKINKKGEGDFHYTAYLVRDAKIELEKQEKPWVNNEIAKHFKSDWKAKVDEYKLLLGDTLEVKGYPVPKDK